MNTDVFRGAACWCVWLRGRWTHFKSPADAIPPPGQAFRKSTYTKHLLQHKPLSSGLANCSGVGSAVGGLLRKGVQPLYCGKSVLWREMTIPHRHPDSIVAWKLVHGANAHSGHDEAAGECMQKEVPAECTQRGYLRG